MHRFILTFTSLFLLASCGTGVKLAYEGPELPPEQTALVWPVSNNMRIGAVNGDNATALGGLVDRAYLKPGVNTVRLIMTEKDGVLNMKYTSRWSVKFQSEAGHTYVFFATPASRPHSHYLEARDMGTNYKYDENTKPSVVIIDARRTGKKVNFLK